MSHPPKTFEMEMPAATLADWSWSKLQHLMDNDLSNYPMDDTDGIDEAELLLKLERAVAEKADFLLVRLRYNEPREDQSK